MIRAEVQATHRDLSEAALQYLKCVTAHPIAASLPDFDAQELPEALDNYPFPLQAWPAIVDQRKLDQLKRITLGMPRLVKTIPERVFDNDPAQIAAFYNLGSETIAKMIISEPNGFDSALARVDFIDGLNGPKCLEVNMTGNIGGWQISFWEPAYRTTPLLAEFLETRGLRARVTDPLSTLLEHLLAEGVNAGMARDGALNIAVALDVASGASMARCLNQRYAPLRKALGLAGEIVSCAYPHGLTMRGGRLHRGQTPVDLVLEFTQKPTPNLVFRAFKAGKALLLNGYSDFVLNDKRNLALLSMHAHDRYTQEESALIDEFTPWTRMLVRGETNWGDESIRIPEDVISRRERLVLKKGLSARGETIMVGSRLSPEHWACWVKQALAEGDWLAQEYVQSRAYLCQWRESWAEHHIAWGLFNFGNRYGGAFLRMAPKAEDSGVINSAQGAAEGVLFEV